MSQPTTLAAGLQQGTGYYGSADPIIRPCVTDSGGVQLTRTDGNVGNFGVLLGEATVQLTGGVIKALTTILPALANQKYGAVIIQSQGADSFITFNPSNTPTTTGSGLRLVSNAVPLQLPIALVAGAQVISAGTPFVYVYAST